MENNNLYNGIDYSLYFILLYSYKFDAFSKLVFLKCQNHKL